MQRLTFDINSCSALIHLLLRLNYYHTGSVRSLQYKMERQTASTSAEEDYTEDSLSIAEPMRSRSKDFEFEDEGINDSDAHKDVQSNSSEDESIRGKALRNPIILRTILKHFPTSFLLSSCSLVNKTWNRDARIFVRNKRKCLANRPQPGLALCPAASTCQIVYGLRNLFDCMREAGRQNPFNGLKINVNIQPREDNGCPEDSGCHCGVHVSLPTEMSLTYLNFDCRVHRAHDNLQDSSEDLIRNYAEEIQHLTLAEGIVFLKSLVNSDRAPGFPNLKEIVIAGMDHNFQTEQKNILRSLHATSPNLRSILVGDIGHLVILPEECYGLLSRLKLGTTDVSEEEALLQRVVDKKPKLRELWIFAVPQDDDETRQSARNFQITQLLESCQDSLEELTIQFNGSHGLPLLAHRVFKNLLRLTVNYNDERTDAQLWNLVTSIDSDNMMPKLAEFTFRGKLSQRVPTEWPASSQEEHTRYTYSSVRKLTLTFECATVNMAGVKAVFPNVTSLDMTLHRLKHVPFGELWELWPNLQELVVDGRELPPGITYDADFCGINKEEAELLRTMDDEYLRTVHIVPIRPSTLTMSNLRIMLIELDGQTPADESGLGNDLAFSIPRVTQLVALERLLARHAKIAWTVHGYENGKYARTVCYP